MEDHVISVSGLGKKFRRDAAAARSHGVSDLFDRIFLRHARPELRSTEFRALQGISFNVARGQALGIIGRNGSGKTTLLRILAGILRADEGRFEIQGNVQAMINLGAGFDLRLSGRDNVLNAAALRGFDKSRSKEVVAQIEAFSELEDVLDAPIGTYSSGMRARLGFAVCVYMEPDILIVDEALSVGDLGFQNKCRLKVLEMRRSGVTMLFVSHGLTAVREFCETAVWLEEGRLMQLGSAKEVTQAYQAWYDELEVARKAKVVNRSEPRRERVASELPAVRRSALFQELYDGAGYVDDLQFDIKSNDVVEPFGSLTCEYSFSTLRYLEDLCVNVRIHRPDGVCVAVMSSIDDGASDDLLCLEPGNVKGRLKIDGLNLVAGSYYLLMAIRTGTAFLYRDVVGEFYVAGGNNLTKGGIVHFNRDNSIEFLPDQQGVSARPSNPDT